MCTSLPCRSSRAGRYAGLGGGDSAVRRLRFGGGTPEALDHGGRWGLCRGVGWASPFLSLGGSLCVCGLFIKADPCFFFFLGAVGRYHLLGCQRSCLFLKRGSGISVPLTVSISSEPQSLRLCALWSLRPTQTQTLRPASLHPKSSCLSASPLTLARDVGVDPELLVSLRGFLALFALKFARGI